MESGEKRPAWWVWPIALLLCAGCARGSVEGGVKGAGSTTAAPAPPQGANANEAEHNGLVLLKDTLKATQSKSGGKVAGKITGSVINRTGRTLGYAQIAFNLLDKRGARVGEAMASTNDLADGARWDFEAPALGHDFVRYKISELTGD
jgi:hypothetical protein